MIDVLIILVLVMINGLFAMTELAVFSAQKTRLQRLAADGSHGARSALTILEQPTRFLSTVQVGITLVAILAGAIGEATLADELSLWFQQSPALAAYAQIAAFVIVVAGVTYVSVTFGEIIPKRIALLHAERLACFFAPPMHVLSTLAYPAVRVLTASTEAALRLIGLSGIRSANVTEEDIRILVEQGAHHGTVLRTEQELVTSVLNLDARPVHALMTPRADLIWIDLDESEEANLRKIADTRRRRYPVAHGNLDHLAGILEMRDLAHHFLMGRKPLIRDCLIQPLLVPESASALEVLERFKKSPIHVAMVADEFGGIEGMVTHSDIMSALVGDMPGVSPDEPEALPRPDGSWLVDGYMGIEDFRRALRLDSFAEEARGDYTTLGGYVMAQLGRLPQTGDVFDADDLRFEVVDMDRRRVDKLLVKRRSRQSTDDAAPKSADDRPA